MDLASDKGEVAIKAKKGDEHSGYGWSGDGGGAKASPSSAESIDDRKDGSASGVVIRSASTLALVGPEHTPWTADGERHLHGGREDGRAL